ncbi:mitochondrial carrier domain-containing protein [Hyaloraphidium curvatum]|nr:mitochondrial carrier domain-containing protein [Hyaloraphidium curvatum]
MAASSAAAVASPAAIPAPVPAAARKPPAPLPLHWNLLAGGLAGMTEILTLYPLDVVKTRLQLQVGKEAGHYTSVMGTLRAIVREEGVLKLYRGILPPIMIEAPKRAVKFSANEQYTATVRSFGIPPSQLSAIIVGVLAGLTEALVVSPPDVLKNRLQDKRNAGRYRNTWDCFTKTLAEDGPLAFTNGLGSAFWKHGVWNAGFFGSIYYVRQLLPVSKKDSQQTAMLKSFASGSLGGIIGTSMNTPFDVIKTRVQILPRSDRTYKPTIPALVRIYRNEGVAALYKGFAPKVMRMAPGGGIVVVVFDYVSAFIREHVLMETED